MKKLIALVIVFLVCFVAMAVFKYMPLIAPVISTQGKTAEQIAEKQDQMNKDLAVTLQQEEEIDPLLISVLTSPIEDPKQGAADTADLKSAPNTTVASEPVVSSTEPAIPQQPSDRDKIINSYLEQIENFKSEYVREILRLIHNAKDEYHRLPADQRTSRAITTIGFKYANKALAMEASADQRYQGIMDNLQKELEALGSDTDIVGEMKTYYKNFKETQKQTYIAEIKAASRK